MQISTHVNIQSLASDSAIELHFLLDSACAQLTMTVQFFFLPKAALLSTDLILKPP